MRVAWTTVLVAAAGCYALKLSGVSLPAATLNRPWIQRIARLLPVAMLSALVATDLFGANGRYAVDWRLLVGVGAAAVALRLGRSLIFVFAIAIIVTAGLRALT